MGPRFLPGRAARRRLRARGAARSPARASQPRLPSSSHRTLLAPPRPTRAGRLPPTAPGIHSVTHQLHIGPTCTLGPSVSIGLCSAILDCHNGADTPHFQPLRPTVTALLCPVPDSALFRRHWATSGRGQTYTLGIPNLPAPPRLAPAHACSGWPPVIDVGLALGPRPALLSACVLIRVSDNSPGRDAHSSPKQPRSTR